MDPQTTNTVPSTTTPMEGPRFQQALESQRAALLAMTENQVERRARLDPSGAFLVAWASTERVAPLRERLVAIFGQAATEHLDALPVIALATRHADIDWMRTTEAVDLSELHREVTAQHRLLITDADSLVNRGFLPAKALDNARSMLGYQASVDSLQVVIAVLRERWPQFEGNTPLTRANLDAAETVAMRMTHAMSQRGLNASEVSASDLRLRALSKLIRTYEEVRRMVTFYRWFEGDADTITPSFYAGRGGRKAGSSDEDVSRDDGPSTDEPVPTPPPTPSPINGGPPFPG